MKQLESGSLPHGAHRTWHNHYQVVDFMKTKGGPYGVKLVLTLDNARKLRNDLRDCMKLAKEHGRKHVEVDAHFGRQTQEGYILRTRVYRPEEKD